MNEREIISQMHELLVVLRAKQSELNLVNAEVSDFNTKAQDMYDDYLEKKKEADKRYAAYEAFGLERKGLNKDLAECRSEIQQTQDKLLSLMIEHTLIGKQPHE